MSKNDDVSTKHVKCKCYLASTISKLMIMAWHQHIGIGFIAKGTISPRALSRVARTDQKLKKNPWVIFGALLIIKLTFL